MFVKESGIQQTFFYSFIKTKGLFYEKQLRPFLYLKIEIVEKLSRFPLNK